ncbi:MAG: potassium channel family protein [Cyanobacteriota bacterium]|nr:potassium channel family protein [Cyanobacteriota bacterium]
MSQRSRTRKRHRFYRHLFGVTLLLVVMQGLPVGVFRVHLLGGILLQVLLLVELGQAIPRAPYSDPKGDRRAQRSAFSYRLLGLLGLISLLIWMFTPASSVYTGLPVMAALTAFVFWSLQRLIKCLGRESSVGGEVVAGAVAGYLLLGISGGLLLTVLETLQPGSFQNLVHEGRHLKTHLFPNSELSRLIWDLDFSRINYFAFVAMTTTGFGDIVPVTPAAEMASVSLSIVGSLYLALVMGLLISRFTVQTQQQEEQEQEEHHQHHHQHQHQQPPP